MEELDGLDDLQSLVDLMLDEEEQQPEDFLIFLRLSPFPQYLVKGYDFKMLNKYVRNLDQSKNLDHNCFANF